MKKEKYIARTFTHYYIGAGLYAVRDFTNKNTVILSGEQLETLSTFKTPRNCVEAYGDLTPAEEIQYLMGKKLIYPVDAYIRREIAANGNKSSEESGDSKIQKIIWTTANRPETLSGSLTYCIDVLREFDRKGEMIILDDSKSPIKNIEYRKALSKIETEPSFPIRYCNRQDRWEYVQLLKSVLSAEGIDKAILDFGLLGSGINTHSLGANRNTMLIESAGEAVLSSDDDILGFFTRHPQFDGSIELSSQPQLIHFDVYNELSEIKQKLTSKKQDFLKLFHCIGNSVLGSIQDDLGGERIVYDHSDSDFLYRLGNGAKVSLMSPGFFGDSGTVSNITYLSARRRHEERTVSDEPTYKSHLYSRNVIAGVSRLSFGRGAAFFGSMFAADNRETLPPFFPIGRNSDGIFSKTLSYYNPLAFSAYLPYLVGHFPPEQRTFTEGTLTDIQPSLSSFVLFMHEAYGKSLQRPPLTKTGSGLGRFIRDIGKLSPSSFTEYCYHIWRSLLGRHVFYHQGLLEYYKGEPWYWAEDVRKTIEAGKQLMLSPTPPLPREISKGFDEERGLEVFQNSVRLFGELIITWPSVIKAAKKLKERGIRPSKAISK